MNRVRKILGAVTIMTLSAVGQSYGSNTIWRQVDAEEFWANPVSWLPNGISDGRVGWIENFEKYREEVTHQLQRLGIPPENVIYYICDIFGLHRRENVFLDFPPRFIPSSPFFAVKGFCKSYKESIFAYPHDTEKEGNSLLVVSLPDSFLRKHYDPRNDTTREFRRFIPGCNDFFGGNGFIVFVFFPAHGDRNNQVMLIKYRIWVPESPRQLCIQAIDPDLSVGVVSQMKEEGIRLSAGPIDCHSVFIRDLGNGKIQVKVFTKGNPYNPPTIREFPTVSRDGTFYFSPECSPRLQELVDFYQKNSDTAIFFHEGAGFQCMIKAEAEPLDATGQEVSERNAEALQTVRYATASTPTVSCATAPVLFRAIGLPDDLVKARVSIFGSVVDSFVINGQTDQLFGLIGLAPTPIEGKLFQDRDQRRIVGVLATKAFNTVPSTDRIDPEIGKRFNDTQQLKKSDYAHLIKVIKRSLMIIEEYEPRFVVEIFDFDNGGILSLVIEVSKAGTTAATLRSIIDFYEENPDTVVLYQNVADLYRKDFAHLELLYHGGPPPGGFSAIKNKK